MDHIRNFVIIAHVDHGKSTLADRLLELTGTVEKRQMKPQYLDSLELERERGITIKMAPVRMAYALGPRSYVLNLIDTPGHSDFSYEVSRALAAVEGAVLLVDATQGMQAQTLAVYEAARKMNLTIIGAVNKIDIAAPDLVAAAVKELADFLSVPEDKILKVSGKTGDGTSELLETIVRRIPYPNPLDPKPHTLNPARALIFDSVYNDHKGIIAFVRVFNGAFRPEEAAKLLATDTDFRVKELGTFSPKLALGTGLSEGEIGYLATGIKDPDRITIGDTILGKSQLPISHYQLLALPGYQEPKPVVFVSFYPEEADSYEELKKALGKLRLTDAALKFEPDSSEVLGRGFKGGFLGRLHFEIAAERLEREFGIRTTHSFPSVAYRVRTNNRQPTTNNKKEPMREEWQTITNPKDFPEDYAEALEPMARMEILTPMKHLSAVLSLREIFRFSEIETKPMGAKILITAKLPLADLIRDLDDKLKSVSEGFASLTYEVAGLERADVAKLEILVAGHVVPGLTQILPREDVEREARKAAERLKELLPQRQFTQAIQGRAHGRIVARETIPALHKDVTGYLYGGDRSRKMKLWKKQQRGKARLKETATQGALKLPASIFKELLKK